MRRGKEGGEKRESGPLTFTTLVSQAGDIITYETKAEVSFDGSGGIVRAGVWICGVTCGHLV